MLCIRVKPRSQPVIPVNMNKLVAWGVVWCKNTADKLIVRSAVKSTEASCWKQASNHNASLARGLFEVSGKINSTGLKTYAEKLAKLSGRQAAFAAKTAQKRVRAEQAACVVSHSWRNLHRDAVKAFRKGVAPGLLAATGFKASLAERARNNLDNVVEKVEAPGAGPLEADQFTALRQITTGARVHDRSSTYWARLYLSSWKFAAVCVLPRCRARESKDRLGNLVSWVPEADSYESDWSRAFIPQYLDMVKSLYTMYVTACNGGVVMPSAGAVASPARFVCGSVRNELRRAFESLSINPEAGYDRLSTIFRAASYRVFEVDWNQAVGLFKSTYHNSSLCDRAVCQFDEACRTISEIGPFADMGDGLRTHARILASLAGSARRVIDADAAISGNGRRVRDQSPGLICRGDEKLASPTVEAIVSRDCVHRTGMDVAVSTCWACDTITDGQANGVCVESESDGALYCQDPCNEEDAGGPGCSYLARGVSRRESHGETTSYTSCSAGSNDSRCSRTVLYADTVEQQRDDMVDPQHSEKRMGIPVGVAVGQNVAGEVAVKVGKASREVLPDGAPQKGRSVRRVAALPDTVLLVPSAPDNARLLSRPVLGAGCARGLLPQPVTSNRWSGAGCNTARGRGRGSTVGRSYAPDKQSVACTPVGKSRGSSFAIPQEATEKISSSVGNVFVDWTDKEGRHYKLIREDGEVMYRGAEWGSKDDPDKGKCVPSCVQPVYKTAGTQFDGAPGPCDRYTNDSKGYEPGRPGPGLAGFMGVKEFTHSDKSRFVPLGHACAAIPDETGDRHVLVAHRRPVVKSMHAGIVEQRVFHQSADKIQGERRRHEWGYDDSSWQLYCSDCNRADVSSASLRDCLRKRRSYCKGSAYVAANHGVRAQVEAGIAGVESSSSEGLDGRLGRRRRPRRNRRRREREALSGSPPTLVGSSGTQLESRRGGNKVVAGGILPAPAVHWRAENHHGAKPSQSYAQVLFGDREVYERPRAVLAHRIYGSRNVAPGHTNARAVFPGPSTRTWTRSNDGIRECRVPTRKQQPALPPQLRGGDVAAAGRAGGVGRRPIPVLGHVEYNSNGAVGVGRE